MITVLCPTFNEAGNIVNILNFFSNSLPKEKELIVIDGGSTDGTREIVIEWSNKFSNIQLMHNQNKYVSFALNLGIKKSKGDPIIRIDAHTKYSADYFEKIIETFNKTNADIVGGPYRIASKSSFQEAVGDAISSSFGTGNSKVHNIDYSGQADSVAYGAWKREIFNEVGYFDEILKRNQDDEFHYRAKSFGKKIYLDSEIKLWYYPRNTFRGLAKQYYEYGLYKPLVLTKVRSEAKLRHFIPAFFVLYNCFLPLYTFWPILFVPLVFYVSIDIYYSFSSHSKLFTRIITLAVYPSIHFFYGLGFIFGIFKLKFRKPLLSNTAN